MCSRVLDAMIVVWCMVVCVLLSTWKDLRAAPGDCDNECRDVKFEASKKTGFPNSCTAYKFADCDVCVNFGGCWKDLPKRDGTCKEVAQPQERWFPTNCAILCNNPVDGQRYEGHTNDPDQNTNPTGKNQKKCLTTDPSEN
jgi:hypothetical protein